MATNLLQSPFWILPAEITWYTVSVWGKLLRSIYLPVICWYKRDQSSAGKTRGEEKLEHSSLSVRPTWVKT